MKFYAGPTLIGESGAYDAAAGVLAHDEHLRIYEAEPGLDAVTAPLVGLPIGPSFHFVLNNKIFVDTRIPPRGFNNAMFAQFGGTPIGRSYADGQYWDTADYDIPAGATSAVVNLYYQSTSKEYVEFLRDENVSNDRGQAMYNLWNNNGKCPPELMRTVTVALSPPQACCLPDGDCENMDESACLSAGGTSHPATACSGDQACCLGGGACLDRDPVCCMALGGAAKGFGTNCGTAACPQCETHAECDDGLFCNGVEQCDPGLGCIDGSQPCGDECQTCDEDADACSWCVLDIDGSGMMGTGDFAMFAGCFGACYSPGDSCTMGNFDGDPGGCVGSSDFAAFAGCFGYTCGQCAACSGPGGAGNSAEASAAAMRSPAAARIHLAVLDQPSKTGQAATPPISLRAAALGQKMYIEVWATTTDAMDGAGLASVYADIRFEPAAIAILSVTHDSRFPLFARSVFEPGGAIAQVGGCADLGQFTLGFGGNWVRVATIWAQAVGAAQSSVTSAASDALHGVAAIGTFKNISPDQIEFGSTRVSVRERSRRISGSPGKVH